MTAEHSPAPAKRALLIAIDRYPYFKGADLQGCVNDMTALAETLKGRFGFPADGVRLLVDAAATRDGILRALDELAAAVADGDIVVLAYAGHGSQVTDLEGDEPDGLDETIVPYDSGRGTGPEGPRPNRDITDDELLRVLARIAGKTANLTVLFDCCHSGSGMRDLDNRHRSAPADQRPAAELGRAPLPPLPAGDKRGFLPISDRYVFAGACRDEERAWELTAPGDDGPVHHGAFSFFLLQELERCAPGDTMRDLFQRLLPKLGAARPGQHAQIEGRLDREIFGVRDIPPVRTIPVLGRFGALVRLDAGLVHGVTVGSQYALFSPDVRPAPDQPPLAVVEVSAVRGVTSDARLVGDANATIEPGLRALELAHAFDPGRDAIQLVDVPGHEAAIASLRALLASSSLLSVVTPGEPAIAQVTVRELGRGAPHFVASGVGGAPILPAYPTAQPTAAAQLFEALEQRARHRRVLLLDNPATTSPLRGAVGMTLLRQQADGTWIPATPDSGGAIVYRVEERLALEITNRSNRWLYIYLLDLGMTGAVGQAYPPEGAHEPLAPGVTVRWFVRDEEPANVYWPDNYPFEVAGQRPALEPNVLKLVASTQQTDLGPLFQRGYQIPKHRAEAPLLERVLGSVLTGGRELRVAHSATPKDDWTAVTQAYYISE